MTSFRVSLCGLQVWQTLQVCCFDFRWTLCLGASMVFQAAVSSAVASECFTALWAPRSFLWKPCGLFPYCKSSACGSHCHPFSSCVLSFASVQGTPCCGTAWQGLIYVKSNMSINRFCSFTHLEDNSYGFLYCLLPFILVCNFCIPRVHFWVGTSPALAYQNIVHGLGHALTGHKAEPNPDLTGGRELKTEIREIFAKLRLFSSQTECYHLVNV